jgi:hypothetical protein
MRFACLIFAIIIFAVSLSGNFMVCSVFGQQLKSAQLCFEAKNSTAPGKEIFINGKKIGEVPLNEGAGFQEKAIEISEEALHAIATVNIINIENKPLNSKRPKFKDLFTLKNMFLEIRNDNGDMVRTNIEKGPFLSFKTGFIESKNEYAYLGAPLPEIRLILPTEKLGYIKQPLFENRIGEEYKDNSRKIWNLDKIDIPRTKRTMCFCRVHEFAFHSDKYLLEMLKRYNSDILMISFSEKYLKDQKEKLKYLRKHGIKINLLCSSALLKDPYNRLPESDKYKDFFKIFAEWVPLVDIVGLDEWFLSPAMLKTDGGYITEITEKFINAFAKYSGYSVKDSKWAFENHTSNDPRSLKAWEFCAKVQNDFAREFVCVAKRANPQIKTWISYITKNWNKHVTCMDEAVKGFDQLLQCQTYWYGRASEDSLNSSLVTAPIGMGKIFKAEYPDKFLWMGIDPFYTGGKKIAVDKNSWGHKHYSNTIEEVVPYLALLYAASNGVYIQNFEGKQLLGYKARDKKHEYLENLGVKGFYVEKFADAVNLVSNIVPYIKSYRKSDIAYYYDPDADFEIVRRVDKYIASRETNETAIGLLEEFCNVDVTKDIKKYQNVIYAGKLLPSKFNYKDQNIYLMYAPEYDEKGDKIPETELSKKLNIKGFTIMGKNFFLGKDYENGNKDKIQIKTLFPNIFASGMIIKDASYSIRKASYVGASANFSVGARNKSGNILLNSMWPSFIRQDIARKIIKKDLDYFGWTRRDCPQVNGVYKIVAVAFRDLRVAVIDFGKEASFTNIKLIMFNGREGVIRNEILKYERGMKIEIPPLNVIVVEGIK